MVIDHHTCEAIERAAFGRNPVAWFEIWGRIEDKEVGSDPNKAPSANYLQLKVGEAVQWCIENGEPIRLILYKPRQQGCSTITVEILYVLGRFVKMKVLVIGGQASQTDNLWKILKYYGDNDKFTWGNEWTCNMERARCSNGTMWERETAGDKEAGRSGNYHAIIATEVARWPTDGKKNASDVLNSVLNCVGDTAGTVVVMESTAQGPEGEFPKTWFSACTLDERRSGKRGNGYIKIFAPWYKFSRCRAPLGDETPEQLRKRISESGDSKALSIWSILKLEPDQIKWYHEVLDKPECGGDPIKRDREYPTFEEDGFKASAPSRFNIEALQLADIYVAQCLHRITYGILENQTPTHAKDYLNVTFRPCGQSQAEVAILEMPVAGERYLISTDNSRGKSFTEGDDTDPHAFVVWRSGKFDARGWHPPEIVAALMPENRWDQDILAELIVRMSGLYGNCLIVPESNRGELLIKCLVDKGANLYQRERRKEEVDSGKETGLWGWETTPETKRFVIETLAAAIRTYNKPGHGMRCGFPWIVKEFYTFVRHKDGSEGALKLRGVHDDFVMAGAIGLAVIDMATTYFPPIRHHGSRIPGLPDDQNRRETW